ncbi:MAG TPA: PhzF family phenazine biosynthesis protein [Acidobacteriaceae bacterium]|nr:PhzF family phenazine biosynthesis protein [Acidobacteriaceae bacterium]
MTHEALDYFILDVFTSRRLEGNALAVVINDGSLSDATMQAIARETNLSETTFVSRRSADVEAREGVRVRIFTTEEELPFAGHPTLGTAGLLRAIAPDSVHDGVVTLALNVGPVAVRFAESPEPWPACGEMTQRAPEFGEELDAETVATLIGLKREELNPGHPVQIVSTGTAFAIVPLRSAASLARLHVKQQEASTYLRQRGARWFYVLGPENDLLSQNGSVPWRARMQFNGGEDPATGSAAGCAISYLVRHGAVASDALVHLRQGVEIARPSDLYLRAHLEGEKVTQVRVGGSTILAAKGSLFLP